MRLSRLFKNPANTARVLSDIAHNKYGVTPPWMSKREEKPLPFSVTVTDTVSITGMVTSQNTRPFPVTIYSTDQSASVNDSVRSQGPLSVTGPNLLPVPVTVTRKNNPPFPVTGKNLLTNPVTVTGILARLADEYWWRKDFPISLAKQGNDKLNRYREPKGDEIIGITWERVIFPITDSSLDRRA